MYKSNPLYTLYESTQNINITWQFRRSQVDKVSHQFLCFKALILMILKEKNHIWKHNYLGLKTLFVIHFLRYSLDELQLPKKTHVENATRPRDPDREGFGAAPRGSTAVERHLHALVSVKRRVRSGCSVEALASRVELTLSKRVVPESTQLFPHF